MSKSLTIPYNFIPTSHQLALFRAMDGEKGKPKTRLRLAALAWDRRRGKDKCSWCYMLKEAAQVRANYFYVFPTKEMAKVALWENIDNDGFKLLDHLPEEYIARISNPGMFIEMKNGSTIRVVGYDKDPDSTRGVNARGVVFSEFSFSDPQAAKNLMPSIRRSGGWAIFNSTPDGRNHFYDLWMVSKDSPNWYSSLIQSYFPDRDGYTFTYTKAEFDIIQKEDMYSDEDMEREYGCSFTTGMRGSFYMDQLEAALESKRISDFVYDETLKVDTFWDLGRDGTSVWFRQKINNKIIFIDYYELIGGTVAQYVRMLEEKDYNYGTHYLPFDADNGNIQTTTTTAEMFSDLLRETNVSDDIQVLERLGFQDGINAVRLKFPRYHFDATKCAVGLEHLEKYHKRFDKRLQTFTDKHVKDGNDHAADALRMEAMSEDIRNDAFYRINNIQMITKYDIFGDND